MSQSENSLLLRIRGDSSGGKAAVAETRAAVAQLRQSLGPELSQTVSSTNKVFSQIGDNLNVFVSQRLPLVGGAFLRVTENIGGLGKEAKKQEAAIKKVADSITNLASTTDKSVPQLTTFLTQFAKIEGQANRDAAAIKFFGAEVLANNAKIIPATEKAATQMATLATATEGVGAAAGGIVLPIGIAVVAITALAAAAVIAIKEIVELSKSTAEFQGRMFDLAQQTGVGVETLSALEIVAKTTGGEIGSLTQSLINFQRKLEEAQDPLSKAADLFNKYDISISDTETALRDALSALAQMPEGFTQTNAAAELFGARGGKQMLAILKESSGDLDAVIKRARELGILISVDDARAADKFNDELAILNFQIRALGAVAVRDLIPALTDIVRSFGEVVTAARPLINIFNTIAGPTARAFAGSMRGLSLIVLGLTGDFKGLVRQIKEMEALKNIPAISIPQLAPVPLPGAPSREEIEAEATRTAEAVVAAARRAAAKTNQALDELFQQGRINREKQAEQLIADNKKVLDAEKSRIDAILAQRETEIKGLNRADTQFEDNFRKLSDQISKLQQERLDKENEFDVASAALRAKAAKERADSIRNQRGNETDLLVNEFDRQIKVIEASIARGATVESEGLTIIEALERAKIDARREGLEEQKRIGFLTVTEQQDLNNRIQALNQEADRLDDEQRARRLQRERATAERIRDIKIGELETTLELERIVAERIIETTEALADRRVVTEEEAAKRILQIRLDLIDQEIEATRARLEAAKTIVDVDERVRTEAELNNRLKILAEQRKTIQTQGNEAIREGRRKDIEDERNYLNQLKEIEDRIFRIHQDAAQEVINLMRLHFASRKAIIAAQLQLDLADAAKRHETQLELIREDQRANDTQIRILERRLKTLQAAGKETSAKYQKAVDDLAAANAKKAALHDEEGAELERSEKEKERILREAQLAQKKATPLGRLGFDAEGLGDFARIIKDAILSPIEAVKQAFAELQDSMRAFVAKTETTIRPLGEILRDAFSQFADALGQVVANWVLLGETGPAVMRKILAQALASIAAEAAVNAIKELALGFATLFFNPAESAAHFTAAGIWASIGGVAALAGRAAAGDLFKPKDSNTGASNGSRGGTGQVNPVTLSRNAGTAPQISTQRIILEVQSNDSHIVKVVGANYNSGGKLRQIIINDGGVD